MSGTIRVDVELPGGPGAVFERLVQELACGLDQRGLWLEEGPAGWLAERRGGGEIARVTAWLPGERLTLAWLPGDGSADPPLELELSLSDAGERTALALELRGIEGALEPTGDALGWLASEAVAPLLRSLAPGALGDWITDRRARRPAGLQARETYAEPLYHRANFRVMLAELALRPDDRLLEIGCGGGALLARALTSGCRAAAVDHSLDMVRLARQANAEALRADRLAVVQADAARLPFRDGSFSCAAMTGVLGFLPDPVAALAEARRTLAPGGRMLLLGSDPRLRGTPAAPEPMASRLRFYDDDELVELGRAAGFAGVELLHRDLEAYARQEGVPAEHLTLFSGATSFLRLRAR